MKLRKMDVVINRKRYQTETSVLLAHDAYWDGQNFERNGRNTFLLRTVRGNYFVQYQTLWQGERDTIQPISREEAIEMYEGLPEKEVPFEEAFGFSPEEA
mgnify:CR=1 FL=1